jgi:hypothetical protein
MSFTKILTWVLGAIGVCISISAMSSLASLAIDSRKTVVTYGDPSGEHTDVISYGGDFLENREYDASNRLVGRMFIDRYRQVHVIRVDPETGVETESITQ